MLEYEFADSFYQYLCANQSDKYIGIAREVPFLSRCIDMVLISKDKKITTIEFKLKDWSRALKQAKDHSLGADKSYICLPNANTNQRLTNTLIAEGIGLLLYDYNNSQVIEQIHANENNHNAFPLRMLLAETTKQVLELNKGNAQ
ncbi:MAG: hypothetical protein LBM77_08145 [Spirochaetaceae bacterium]|jgi:hypothetical protein|nr:hypothetical protein [Spirochaetaceae bacterium]